MYNNINMNSSQMPGMSSGLPGINPFLGGMNPGFGMLSGMVDIDDINGWNLIFEDPVDKKSLCIRISEKKLVKEAINMYYLKTGRNDKCRFIFNHQDLFGEMIICQSGLNNLSRILVVGFYDDSDGWELIFENEEDKKNFSIRISEQKLVKEAIMIYMLKSGRTDKCKFIFNNKELFGEMKICKSGLYNMSKIIVVPKSLDSIPFRNNNSSNHNLNPQKNNFNQNYYESQINELKEQLTKEKNKNSILMNENAKLNEMINNMNSNQLFLNNKISFLENELNKKNMEIQNYLNNMNNINNYNINDLVTSINPGEKIITVNFVSNGFQDIVNYSIPCKNTSLFIRLEEKLNNDFPQLKNHETFFVVNTRRIKRFQTLEENQIKSNDVISIFTIDA